ncbi:MAG: DUF1512 domain-containing protein [Thaumarchaeota archaeon]|nr:DUF1512 domain-containing protein [Nitrososphaerota archaeon]RNJ71363.1 MAG: DUF1512 domain-containing protein [Thaumarchaeota archaeon S14]RNJ74296.1 MAG: DUF1512 domain-containing protein [Thaumarchaeota archaeon S13]MDD9809793.1 DUF1512 domain-containing protein [Nitrososphaerota archaeon]MDD9814216.1 DUF1512 domain-containing protein [Nitrososphaerota archaeon]
MEDELASLFSLGDDSALLTLVWILPVIILIFYGQRIQLYITSGEIGKKIGKLDEYATESRDELLRSARGMLEPGFEDRLERIIDYFTIVPVDMDPAGMVERVRHVVRSREDSTRAHIESMASGLSEQEVARAQALVEVCATLRSLHAMVRHLHLTAKKQNNYPLILPLQMMLPFVMEQAEALHASMAAFARPVPVGDGIGPMVVGSMMSGLEKREAAFQTVAADAELDGRRLVLVKARGPMPTVGRLEDALASLVASSRPDVIVMVDAALKLEGEETGAIAHGFGAAMGGTGAERASIEALATREGIPVHSVVVKESVKDALSPMREAIAAAAPAAADAVRAAVTENAPRGALVAVLGVGNTSGVSQ